MFTRKLDAYRVYLLLVGVQSLALATVFTINMVYQVTIVGLNPLQLVLVGTALELTAFVFEIPTGIVADVYSRRLSIIIGLCLIGAGMVVEGLFPIFGVLLLANIIAGIGYTFTSGATDAWIVDEIGQERAAPAFVRGAQIGQIAGLAGIILSVVLASIQLNIPIVVGGSLLIALAFLLMTIMPEEGFTPLPREDRESWQSLFRTFREGVQVVRTRRILVTILLIGVIYGAFSEGFDRLWTAHILNNFSLPSIGELDTVVWFGIISAAGTPFALLANEWVNRKTDYTNHHAIARRLIGIYALLIVALISFAIAGNFLLALAALWSIGTLRSTTHPLTMAWLNQFVDSKVRATVLSIWAQSDALGQIAGGPVVGAIGTISSLRVAMSISALILIPVLPLLKRTMSAKIKPPTTS